MRLGEAIEAAGRGFRAGGARGHGDFALAGGRHAARRRRPEPRRKEAPRERRLPLRSIERLEARSGADRDALQQLLHHIALDPSDPDEPEAGRQVTLSSLHSAKGLEFSVVFLIGCVEGVLPHARTIDPKITDASMADLEEERRLFYVGVTRARDVLYLTRHKDRVARGRLVKITPSRFLQGLPDADSGELPEQRQPRARTAGSRGHGQGACSNASARPTLELVLVLAEERLGVDRRTDRDVPVVADVERVAAGRCRWRSSMGCKPNWAKMSAKTLPS